MAETRHCAGAAGLPVVLVHPSFPVGEGDTAPTPTGRTIVEFLNGRIPAFVDTALNVAHVDDVARGHVLAAERGELGRSYILGGENMTLQQMLAWPSLRVARPAGIAATRAAGSCAALVVRSRCAPGGAHPSGAGADGDDADGIRHRPLPHRARYTSGPHSAAPRNVWSMAREAGGAERIRNAGGLAPEVDLRIVPTEPRPAPSPAASES